jgi:hypothetical protein
MIESIYSPKKLGQTPLVWRSGYGTKISIESALLVKLAAVVALAMLGVMTLPIAITPTVRMARDCFCQGFIGFIVCKSLQSGHRFGSMSKARSLIEQDNMMRLIAAR